MESIDKLKIGCGTAVALLCALYFIMPWFYSRQGEAERKTPVAQISRDIYARPQVALAQARSILSGSGKEAEKDAVRALMPSCLQQAFLKSLRATNIAAAAELYTEAVRDYPDSSDTYWMRAEWGRHQIACARGAIASNDTRSARAYLDTARQVLPPNVQTEQGEVARLGVGLLLADWRAACAADSAESEAAWKAWADVCAMLDLVVEPMLRNREASPGESMNNDNRRANVEIDLADELLVQWKNQTNLATTADWLRKIDRAASALPFYVAAIRVMGVELNAARNTDRERAVYDARKATMARLCDCMVEVASAPECAPASGVMLCEWAGRFSEASITCRLDAAMCALSLACKQFAAMTGEIDMPGLVTSAQTTTAARARLWQRSEAMRDLADSIAQRHVPAAWHAQKAMPGFDCWKDVPDSVVASLKSSGQSDDLSSRGYELDDLVRKGAWTPPSIPTDAYRSGLPVFHAVRGMAGIGDRRPMALESLRIALRSSSDDALHAAVRTCVQSAMRLAVGAKDYSAMFDLSSFYVAEFGPPAGDDPFHPSLKAMVGSSIKEFERDAPMKHLFMLAVMATCFPDDPDGVAARLKAMKLGPARVASLSPSLKDDMTLPLPSGLDQLSVVAVDNNTEYYILMFYTGPENFLVRLDPYRRGSMVLSNGTYVAAVISTSDDVVPYQSRFTCKSSYVPKSYVIKTSSGGNSWSGQSSANGPYTLLRTPVGMKDISIDTKTGIAKPAKE